MRILLVVPHDEEIGGVASVVRNLAKYLTSQSHQVFFLHPAATVFLKQKKTKLGYPGFDLRLQMLFGERHPAISLLAFLILFPVGLCQLIRLIRKYKIQVINIHYPADLFVYFAICRRILPIRLITSIHGADIFSGNGHAVHYSRAFKFLLSESDLVVAPSRRCQEDFQAVFPELTDKTTYIHNGVDLSELNGYGLEQQGNDQVSYILCISAYKEQKALDVLIRAFSQLQGTFSSLKLVLVGAGPLREQLEKLAISLGVYERIDFLGQQKRPEVAKLLRGSKLFVLPSRFETFGIVLLEAMACKKPVVASRAGGIPEIIENGKTGILVEPDNPDALAGALATVLQDQQLLADIASNGCAAVYERFSSEKTGSSYEAIFANLLGSSVNTMRSSA